MCVPPFYGGGYLDDISSRPNFGRMAARPKLNLCLSSTASATELKPIQIIKML